MQKKITKGILYAYLIKQMHVNFWNSQHKNIVSQTLGKFVIIL